MKRIKYLVGVVGPRAWGGLRSGQHAGHAEAILQQRQLFTRDQQEGRGRGGRHRGWRGAPVERRERGRDNEQREEKEEEISGRRKVKIREGRQKKTKSVQKKASS